MTDDISDITNIRSISDKRKQKSQEKRDKNLPATLADVGLLNERLDILEHELETLNLLLLKTLRLLKRAVADGELGKG